MLLKCREILMATTICLGILSSSCGESPEARSRSAQPTAEKYFEYVKAGDYAGAYRNTFSKTHKAQLDVDSFAIYRARLAATTGTLSNIALVESKDSPEIKRVRLTYALHGEGHPVSPPTEVLDLEREDGEWKILAVDFRMPSPEQPNKQPESIPLPGFKGDAKAPHPPARK